ncbi:MAG: hypothetical protein LBT02_02850, partial [Rickettsiales bacterium]|nr:hypothetical protein [Rickettsiales bacterium]
NIPPDADKKLKEIARSYMDDIKNLFAGQIKSNAIIVITADYDMNDAFKKLNNDKIAVLCCYEDDINNIKNVIKNNLASFNYGPDVFNYLCDCLGDNRDILLNELEKLKMYKGGEKAITLNDVKKCIQDETGANINDLVNAVANLDMENTYLEINKLLSDGYATIMQLRILITYFLKLQLYRYKMNNGFTLDELEKGNRMFWKTGNTMRMHLEKLSLDNINHALQSLLQEERILKSSSYFN